MYYNRLKYFLIKFLNIIVKINMKIYIQDFPNDTDTQDLFFNYSKVPLLPLESFLSTPEVIFFTDLSWCENFPPTYSQHIFLKIFSLELFLIVDSLLATSFFLTHSLACVIFRQ